MAFIVSEIEDHRPPAQVEQTTTWAGRSKGNEVQRSTNTPCQQLRGNTLLNTQRDRRLGTLRMNSALRQVGASRLGEAETNERL